MVEAKNILDRHGIDHALFEESIMEATRYLLKATDAGAITYGSVRAEDGVWLRYNIEIGGIGCSFREKDKANGDYKVSPSESTRHNLVSLIMNGGCKITYRDTNDPAGKTYRMDRKDLLDFAHEFIGKTETEPFIDAQ